MVNRFINWSLFLLEFINSFLGRELNYVHHGVYLNLGYNCKSLIECFVWGGGGACNWFPFFSLFSFQLNTNM